MNDNWICTEVVKPEPDDNFNTGHSNTGSNNTGNHNVGDYNSGNHNVGNHNIGCSNTGKSNEGNANAGHCNRGSHNTGHWNYCDNETGYFNTKNSGVIRVFDQPCSMEEWLNAKKPSFLYFEIQAGETYKQAFWRSYSGATEADKLLLKQLPNFDKDVFFKISGIMVE